MKISWTKGLDTDEKKEVELSYNASGVLRLRLIKLLEDKIASYEKESYSKEGYECPNWAYKQADLQGYKRALKDAITLLN